MVQLHSSVTSLIKYGLFTIHRDPGSIAGAYLSFTARRKMDARRRALKTAARRIKVAQASKKASTEAKSAELALCELALKSVAYGPQDVLQGKQPRRVFVAFGSKLPTEAELRGWTVDAWADSYAKN